MMQLALALLFAPVILLMGSALLRVFGRAVDVVSARSGRNLDRYRFRICLSLAYFTVSGWLVAVVFLLRWILLEGAWSL